MKARSSLEERSALIARLLLQMVESIEPESVEGVRMRTTLSRFGLDTEGLREQMASKGT